MRYVYKNENYCFIPKVNDQKKCTQCRNNKIIFKEFHHQFTLVKTQIATYCI